MLKSFLSLFLRSDCALCQRPADGCLCDYCERQLQNYKSSNLKEYWHGDLPAFVWGVYDGQLKQGIAALKYNNHRRLGELMGFWLAQAWLASPLAAQLPKKITVIPIPLHPDKFKSRGFNQAELIALGFCQLTGYTHLPQGLSRVRNTQAMFGLNSQQRTDNLKNAFAVGERLFPRAKYPILLVDDIYTTGTTVREAAKILREEGFDVVGVLAIARPKKGKQN